MKKKTFPTNFKVGVTFIHIESKIVRALEKVYLKILNSISSIYIISVHVRKRIVNLKEFRKPRSCTYLKLRKEQQQHNV